MKTRYWILIFAAAALVCAGSLFFLRDTAPAAAAEIWSEGKLLRTVDLGVDQEFSVGGHNTVTVKDGKIAVTWADCPDHYCMKRGFCASGADIVCLPNRLVIHFTGAPEVDGVAG